jgi:hypothetical protein
MSKRPDSIVDVSMKVFAYVMAALQSKGLWGTVIVATLVEIIIKTAVADQEHAQMHWISWLRS